MSASPELTHYLSQPPSVAQDAPSGDAGVKQAAQVGARGRLVVLNAAVKSDSNVGNRLKRFIRVLGGYLG